MGYIGVITHVINPQNQWHDLEWQENGLFEDGCPIESLVFCFEPIKLV